MVHETILNLYNIFSAPISDAEREQQAFALLSDAFNHVSAQALPVYADELMRTLSLEAVPLYVAEYILLVTKLRSHKTTVREQFIRRLEQYLVETQNMDSKEASARLARIM